MKFHAPGPQAMRKPSRSPAGRKGYNWVFRDAVQTGRHTRCFTFHRTCSHSPPFCTSSLTSHEDVPIFGEKKLGLNTVVHGNAGAVPNAKLPQRNVRA